MTQGNDQGLPAWLPEQLWADWKAHRAELVKMKRGAKPFTPTAEKRALVKLGRLRAQGCDPVAVIERSIEKGWEGLFALPDADRTAFKEKRVNGSTLSLAEQDALTWKKAEPPRPRAAGEVAKRFLDELRGRLGG